MKQTVNENDNPAQTEKIRAGQWVGGIALLFGAILFLFGYYFHPVMMHGPENDGYVFSANQLLAGSLPVDPYRPMFYPILIAGLSLLTGDTFFAAKFISHVAAAALAAATYLLGRRCFSQTVGTIAAILLVLNTHVISAGVIAATDMLFATMSTFTLLVAVRREVNYVSLLLLALLFAISYFTRYTAIALLPVIAFGLWFRPSTDKHVRVIQFSMFAITSAFFLLPHFALTTKVFGNPFYSESWQSLAFKLYGNGDWSYLRHLPFDGLVSVVMHDPARFALSAFSEMASFLSFGLIKLCGNGRFTIGVPLFICFYGGLYISLRKMKFEQTLILLYFLIYTIMVCTTYFHKPRFMIAVLPVILIVVGHFVSIVWKDIQRYHTNWTLPLLICVGLMITLNVAYISVDQYRFVKKQPIPEKEAAMGIIAEHGTDISLLTTYRHMEFHLPDVEIFYLDGYNLPLQLDKSPYFAELHKQVQRGIPTFLIVGKATLGQRPEELLSNEGLSRSYLIPLHITPEVAVYRIRE